MSSEHARSNRAYEEPWPPVRGDYTVGDPKGCVAVVTLASQISVQGAAIYGPCKTENLGIEKIVANTISNSNIRFLLICGAESKGHLPGDSILALHRNGIDEKGRILGARGAIPFIQNLTMEAIKRFQKQLELIERIGLENQDEIERLVALYSLKAEPFSEEPFAVFKKKARRTAVQAGEGDLWMGAGVVMSTSTWLVRRGNDYVQV